MARPEKIMTDNERLFAENWLVHGEAKRAYRTVFPEVTDSSAESMGSRLLRTKRIKDYLTAKQERLSIEIDLDIRQVADRLKAILFSTLVDSLDPETGALKPMHVWPEGLQQSIAGMDVTETYERALCAQCGGAGESGDQPIKVRTGRVTKLKLWGATEAAKQLMVHLGGNKPVEVSAEVSLADMITAAGEPRADSDDTDEPVNDMATPVNEPTTDDEAGF